MSEKMKSPSKKFIEEQAAFMQDCLVEFIFFKMFNRKVINFLFFVVFLSNVFINVDHGSLPGCAE